MEDEDDTPRHKRKSSSKKLKSRYINGDNTTDTLGQPSGKFDYLVKYTPPSWASPEQVPTVSMYQPTRPYDDDFPALQEQVKDRVRTLPQVHNPLGVDADGRKNKKFNNQIKNYKGSELSFFSSIYLYLKGLELYHLIS